MNVKLSLLRISRRLLPAAALCLCVAFSASGQGMQRYERLLGRNLWNGGNNAAGLRADSLSFSAAEAVGLYRAGDFRSPDEAASEWSAALEAKTVTHLEKFSMRGAFGFEDREAYDACGSMFIDAGRFPVDVVEFTPGRESHQTYTMYGGVAVDLMPGWRIGAALDFRSRNAAKRKDLRYTDYALDFKLRPSVMYFSGDFAAGLSLIYDRSTQTVNAEQIGSATTAPTAFFDEGLCIGTLQAWTGSGTRLSEPGVSGLPVVQTALGAAAQLQPCRSVYAEAAVRYLRGRVGERQTVWYRYEGPRADLNLALRRGRHTLRALAALELLSNRESVLDKVVEGGITITREYGSNAILRRSSLDSGVEYEYLSNLLELRAALASQSRRSLATPTYPYVYTQDLRRFSASAEALVHIGAFDAGARLSYLQGCVSDGERIAGGFSGDASESVSAPYRFAERYEALCEFATAPRAGGGLSLRWNFFRGLYAEAFGNCTKAFSLDCISGSLRWSAGLKTGYNF